MGVVEVAVEALQDDAEEARTAAANTAAALVELEDAVTAASARLAALEEGVAMNVSAVGSPEFVLPTPVGGVRSAGRSVGWHKREELVETRRGVFVSPPSGGGR